MGPNICVKLMAKPLCDLIPSALRAMAAAYANRSTAVGQKPTSQTTYLTPSRYPSSGATRFKGFLSMKAITYSRYGPPDVLQLKDVEKPKPEDDEVLIKIRAVEVTKSDCEMRSFKYSVKWFWLPLRIAFGVRKPRRQILGSYFSGEIESTGKDVIHFSVGDQVFGAARLRLGAYGEYVALPASYTIVAKPNNMSFAEAAAVPLGGLNALHFMRRAEIRAGEKVLINGAGGSIGAHAVQVAKSMEA